MYSVNGSSEWAVYTRKFITSKHKLVSTAEEVCLCGSHGYPLLSTPYATDILNGMLPFLDVSFLLQGTPPPDRMWYALYYITSRKHILTITLIPSHNNTTHKNTDFLHCRSQPLCGDWRMRSSSSCTWRAKLVVHSPACNNSKAATITKKDRLYYIGKTFIAWRITLYYRATIQHVLLS